jgi:hypothetical protein
MIMSTTGTYVSKSGVKSATLQGEESTSTAYIAKLEKQKASGVPTESKFPYRELVLESIDTKEQLADVFTKALDTKQFQFLRDHLVRPRSSVMV